MEGLVAGSPFIPSTRHTVTGRPLSAPLAPQRNATGYFNVLSDEGRVVVGALLAADPDAAMPEVRARARDPGSLIPPSPPTPPHPPPPATLAPPHTRECSVCEVGKK
jgi:hypothetical protein